MSRIGETTKIQRGGLIWVEFKGHRREKFLNPYEFPFKKNDVAIVEADRGEDAGMVKHVRQYFAETMPRPEYSVIRKATIQDKERIEWLKEREGEALEICTEKVQKHNLPMRLLDSEYRFDGLKLIFYFTADGRVDFRELVRDLAGTFRTRIELRQIGSRDALKRQDSYGVCGYRLCCVSFLESFSPITTNMAKAQNLILNPSKLSGVCGKLKCCLNYEYEFYEDEFTAQEQQEEITEPGIRDKDIDELSD